MTYHQPFQVIGFHSCDKEVGIKALNGDLELNKNSGESLPINDGPKRNLDCAVIKAVHEMVKQGGLQRYDTVRCAFAECAEA